MSHTLPRLLLLTVTTSVACEPVLTRDVGVEGMLRGYVYDDYTFIEEYAILEEAELVVRDANGADTGEIEAFPESPGYFQVTVEPGQPIELVVSAPDRLTTVRATTGPATLADYSPYLFPRASEVITPTLDDMAEQLGMADSTDLLAGEVGAFWMEPLVPADWAGADISLVSDDGTPVEFAALSDGESGVELLAAAAVPAGRLTLSVTTATGASVEHTWTVQAGELIDATWFHLPQ